MIFWLIVAATSAAATWVLLAPMRGAGRAVGAAEDDGADLRIYRDQLAEVDRDVARGTLAADEAGRIRTEVQRRILEADRASRQTSAGDAQGAPIAAQRALMIAVPLVLVGAALALYSSLGAPGTADLSMADRLAQAETMRAERPSQAEAEAASPPRPVPDADPQFLKLMEDLRGAVTNRPDDLQGQELLARNEALLNNFAAAATAQTAVVRLKGANVTSADHAELAGLMILAADGIVTAEAETALVAALQADQTNGVARYYAGLLQVQIGRPDQAFQMWRALLEDSTPDAPWVAPIRAQIDELAQAAGVNYAPPPVSTERGPSAEDVANAADMTPEERQQMIRGMVDGLSDRLATEGGPASDWARLIGALGVLGQVDRAAEIYREAREVFAVNPDDLAVLAKAASGAGVAP